MRGWNSFHPRMEFPPRPLPRVLLGSRHVRKGAQKSPKALRFAVALGLRNEGRYCVGLYLCVGVVALGGFLLAVEAEV